MLCLVPRLSHSVPIIFQIAAGAGGYTTHSHKVVVEGEDLNPGGLERTWNLTWCFPSHQAGMGNYK